MPNRLSLLTLLLGAPAAASAQTAAPAPAAAPESWLVVDSAARRVQLSLTVTRPAGAASALINGQRDGGVQVVVPVGWSVAWDWRSADSTSPHSLVVMAEREKLPTEGGPPAFINAMTRSVTTGLTPAQGDRTTFEAEQAGWYWLLCGVPGHAIAGEWIGLKVDAEATTAAVKQK